MHSAVGPALRQANGDNWRQQSRQPQLQGPLFDPLQSGRSIDSGLLGYFQANTETTQVYCCLGCRFTMPSVLRSEKISVLKFVLLREPPSLDPIWTAPFDGRCQAFMVFDTPYGQAGADQGFARKPQTIAGHTVESDGKTWMLTLRDGLVFHDGTKVLARDCLASIRPWSARDLFGQTLMQHIVSSGTSIPIRPVQSGLCRPGMPMIRRDSRIIVQGVAAGGYRGFLRPNWLFLHSTTR